MIDLLLQAGLSNLLVSLALALVAWTVQVWGKRPLLAHLLWLLVLVKLVTPPLVTLPLVSLPASAPIELRAPGLQTTVPESLPLLPSSGPLEDFAAAPAPAAETTWSLGALVSSREGLGWLWLLGSLAVLTTSLARIRRFHVLLGQASQPAADEVQRSAAALAVRLGLARTPTVYATAARLSPMVWWVGGRARVFVPRELLMDLEPESLRWVLAHELGHLRRRDHLVRWLEWLACVCFWWNPVAWWARRSLRQNEELCCDALVLGALNPDPTDYAGSLLSVAEFLSSPPALPAPALASALDSGDSLERRILMIVSGRPLTTTSRRLQACVLLCAMALLPLGVAQAQEPDYEAVGDRLLKAVEKGELSADQAEAMMGKLAKVHFAERLALLKAKRAHKKEGKRNKLKSKHKAKHKDAFAWIPGYLAKIGLDPKQAKQVQGAMKKVVAISQAGTQGPRAYAWVPVYLKGLGLSPEQVEQVEGAMKKLVGQVRDREESPHPSKVGLSEQALGKHRHVLHKAGFSKEQAEGALKVVAKLAYVWKHKPEAADDAFHAEVKDYLREELKLSGEQIGLVFGVAKRVVHGQKRGQGAARAKIRRHYLDLGVNKNTLGKLEGALEESGLEGEQIDQALGGIARLLYGHLDPGSRDQLQEGLERHFKKSGFTSEQIERMVGMSKRLFPSVKERMVKAKAKGTNHLAKALAKFGVTPKVYAHLVERLEELGVKGEAQERTLGAMTKILHGMKSQGDAFSLDPKFEAYLAQQGLSGEQVEAVVNLCRRLNGIR